MGSTKAPAVAAGAHAFLVQAMGLQKLLTPVVADQVLELQQLARHVLQDINWSAVEIIQMGPAGHAQASLLQDTTQKTASLHLARPALLASTRQDVLEQAAEFAHRAQVLTKAIRYITAPVVRELILVSCLSATLALPVSIVAAARGAVLAFA